MTTRRKDTLLGIGLLLMFIYLITTGLIHRKKLNASNTFGIGKVVDFSVGGRGAGGTIWLDYVYTVNGRHFKGSNSYSTSKIDPAMIKPRLLRRSFPIIYSTYDPSVSTMLLLRKDFKRWGYAQPDSLKELVSIISAE